MTELVRSLVKLGWAVLNEGTDIDMPMGAGVKLAAGLPGANGLEDLPANADPAVLEARQAMLAR